MTNGRKPHRQQSLGSWIRSKFRRRATFRVAVFILNMISLVARIVDWFR